MLTLCRALLSLCLACLLLLFIPTAHAHSPQHLLQKNNFSAILKHAMPAVVNLSVRGEIKHPSNPFAQNKDFQKQIPLGLLPQSKFQHLGSGVIVDAKHGYLLTNAHVIQHAQTITVSLSDGRHFMGKLIGEDIPSDLAVLQIKPDQLTSIPFADSEQLNVGDFVAAIGNPFGLNQTVTSGMVSALNRHIGLEGYENFIQTDASINPGNSGGALINLKGQLVGINTAIFSASGGSLGIGFAIPSNMAHSVMQQIIQHGKVKRGLLGVMVQTLNPSLATALNLNGIQGALVTEVAPGSTAAHAGIATKDVIIAINDKAINNSEQLRSAIGLVRAGTTVKLTIQRKQKRLTLTPRIQPRTTTAQTPRNVLLEGMRMRTYDQLDMSGQPVKGVQIIDINDRSLAWFNGIRPGDVILSINNHNTPTLNTLLATVKHADNQALLLKVKRFNGTLFFVIKAAGA